MTEPILTAHHLTFSFAVPAQAVPNLFAGLDLTLAAGEIVGLIGPPGSGKSVLFKLLAGLLDPQDGEVIVFGRSFRGLAEAERYALRANIGMVFQNNALFDFLSIYDNVAFPIRNASNVDERVRERLDTVGLGHAHALFPHELSGGMKKRASIARATVTRPRLCLYDEPTAGLDPVTAAKIYRLITDFARRDGSTALIISNELDTLLPACDRVLMLFAGAIVYSGSSRDLQTAKHPAVRQFTAGANDGPL